MQSSGRCSPVAGPPVLGGLLVAVLVLRGTSKRRAPVCLICPALHLVAICIFSAAMSTGVSTRRRAALSLAKRGGRAAGCRRAKSRRAQLKRKRKKGRGGDRRSDIFKAMRKDNPPPTNIEKVADIRAEVGVALLM